MSKNKYPVSVSDQLSLWIECIDEAIKYSHKENRDGNHTLAMAQSFFQYRIGVLNDRILDHDMLEATDKELGLLSEDSDL